jgi:hypothetical protein
LPSTQHTTCFDPHGSSSGAFRYTLLVIALQRNILIYILHLHILLRRRQIYVPLLVYLRIQNFRNKFILRKFCMHFSAKHFYTYYHPYHPLRFGHSNNIWPGAKITKGTIFFCSFPCSVFFSGSNYLLLTLQKPPVQDSGLKNVNATF